MDDVLVPVMVVGMLFIGLPWLVLHYVSKWKSNASLPVEDERLLDDLYELARRLEDRVHTVERIVTADNPDWRPSLRSDPLRDEQDRLRGDRYADDRYADDRPHQLIDRDDRPVDPRRQYRQEGSY